MMSTFHAFMLDSTIRPKKHANPAEIHAVDYKVQSGNGNSQLEKRVAPKEENELSETREDHKEFLAVVDDDEATEGKPQINSSRFS